MSDVGLMSILRWTEEDCYEYLETQRWPDGPECPHCGSPDPLRVERRSFSKNLVKRLYRCRDCLKQFSATVGTVFEDSKIPLSKWFVAIDMMCTSKTGINAHQIHREMGVTYKSARYMCQRIRSVIEEAEAPAPARRRSRSSKT